MPSPRFEKVQELFRQRSEIDLKIELLLEGDIVEPASPSKPEQSYRVANIYAKDGKIVADGHYTVGKKPCGCSTRGRSKASCRTCNPVDPEDEGEAEPAWADELPQPVKRYKCIECGREVESRQHRLDLTCAPPCFNKTLVEVFNTKTV